MARTDSTTITRMVDNAVAYVVEAGWRVHPCRPDKTPLTKSWKRDASNDPDIVRAMWKRWPNAGIAVCCGPDSIDVLDIDEKGEAHGRQLAERAWRAGLLNGWVASIRTPSGGTHLWYPGTDQGGGAIGRKRDLELKSAGGYVLLPPSHVRIPGKVDGYYEVTANKDQGHPLDWAAVKRLLDPPRPAPVPFTRRRDEAPTFDGLIRHVSEECVVEGNCNSALFWAACRAVESGADEQVLRGLVDAAVAGGHPLIGAEATVRSAQRIVSRRAA